MAFKKGQSGNPGGRPKGSRTIDLIGLLRKRAKAEKKKDEDFYANQVIDHILKHYKKDPRLTIWVADHLFGKASQPIVGPDGGPVQVQEVKVTFKKK